MRLEQVHELFIDRLRVIYIFHRALYLSLIVLATAIFSLVVELFTFYEGEVDFDNAALEVHF